MQVTFNVWRHAEFVTDFGIKRLKLVVTSINFSLLLLLTLDNIALKVIRDRVSLQENGFGELSPSLGPWPRYWLEVLLAHSRPVIEKSYTHSSANVLPNAA